MLPALQDAIKRIDKVYNPIGYQIMIPIGKRGSQNAMHFYMRVVPKYKKGYGTCFLDSVGDTRGAATPQEYQESKEKLQPNQAGILTKKSQVVAKLIDMERKLPHGYVAIIPKKPIPNTSNGINQLDQET